jgi:hypothetical protein
MERKQITHICTVHNPMTNLYVCALSAFVGFALCAPVNALVNNLERSRCADSATHELITNARGFFGTEHRCIDRRFL